MRRRVFSITRSMCCVPAIIFATGFVASADESAKQFSKSDLDFFERRVRPVLARNCFQCHGKKKQEAGLRLDSRKSVIHGSDGGPVVVSGKPKASSLVEAIRYGGDVKMPPNKKLPENQIADIIRWIKMGAPWPRENSGQPTGESDANPHWAFQSVSMPPIPAVKKETWPLATIDRFVLARLEAAKLEPSPRATKRTVIRRVTYGLTGLPPSPEQIDEFLEDDQPDALARLIDRLLASPHYGERWGRHWLDVARYADNKGYVFFEDKSFPWAYTYRDYVVEAFNRDLPFDRFIIEQLAADHVVTDDDRSILRAMGYLTLGARFMNNTHDITDDRIDVVTRGMMGLTVTCARCHDHKFDPIPQADYYSLYGIFRSSQQPTIPPLYFTPPQSEEYKKFDAGMRERVKKFDDFVGRLHSDIVKAARSRAAEYLMAVHARRNQPSTENFMLLTDKGGLNPHVITRWESYLKETKRVDHPVWGPWNRFSEIADDQFSMQAAVIHRELFASGQTSKAAEIINSKVREVLGASVPSTMKEVAERYGKLLNEIGTKWQKTIADAASKKEAPPSRLADEAEEQLRQEFYGENSAPMLPRTPGWGFLSLIPDRPTQGEFKKLIGEVEKWSKTGPGAPPRAMVMVDRPILHEPVVFLRGNPNRRGSAVPRQFLGIVAGPNRQPYTDGSGRLELAKSIASSSNPLTARVIVNRVWARHFGRGLVTTPSDFGTRSDPPSHPELLNYLASRFTTPIDQGGWGWSLKRLHREILLSSTYQQVSDHRDDAFAVDPENQLLARMNRMRLDFEAMRDGLLFVTGTMNHEMGGYPPRIDTPKFVPRRTIYGYIDRMNMPNLLRSFDFPSPAASSPKRSETTVPPQALFMMNHNFLAECASRLADRIKNNSQKAMEVQVQSLYRIALSREPTQSEMKLAREFIGKNRVGWHVYTHAMLMTNEFVFID